MGDVVSLKPDAPVIAERFHEITECARFGGSRLVIARSRIEGGSHLSVLLADLLEGQGFEILATLPDTDMGRAGAQVIADAVSLAALHLMPNGPDPAGPFPRAG